MAAHPGLPVPAELLRPGLWVANVVYLPLETELVLAAIGG
ncbi:shikimate dehydrogenase [Saccharopolyspora shandongensis]|uniref:Shikimate dehydrogenase n=1 Tax=Saccharopolyspora shandongensis TaxID=418495 RepID=A0A1H3RPI7_9PSEU|nr:shikimate dehydrogenase [Saccharopolyspora shandongensis]